MSICDSNHVLRRCVNTVLLAVALLLGGCQESATTNNSGKDDADVRPPVATDSEDVGSGSETASDPGDVEVADPPEATSDQDAGADDEALAAWLAQLRAGEIAPVNMESDLDWGLGFFLYYSDIDSIRALAIDQIIYHTLVVHRKVDTGEVSEETLTQNQRNLLHIAEEIHYDSNAPLPDQVSQTGEIRQTILAHIVEDQQHLAPAEALASNNVVGVFGPPAAEAIGGKYLVFAQDTPDADFRFVGVILAVDAAGAGSGPSYSHQGWNNLVWLGDASGPFWEDLPLGNSGDPANTGEARPGVLLISQDLYEEIMAQAIWGAFS